MKAIFALLASTLLLAIPEIADAQLPPRERVGVRIGYVQAEGGLRNQFGNGANITLQFTERLRYPWYMDIRIGAIYMGTFPAQIIAFGPVGPEVADAEMRPLMVTFGVQYARVINEEFTGYGAVGLGIYSISVLFDSGLNAWSDSDQHLGGHIGGGVLLKMFGDWNLDLNVTLHGMSTSKNDNDLFFFFTNDDNPVLLQGAVGMTLDLN